MLMGFFRWVPSQVNHSDRGSRFYDADYDPSKCLLSRLRVLQHALRTMHHPALLPVHHGHHTTASLVNSADQCGTAESPVSLVLQTCVSLLEHQSDAPETPVSCVDQDSVSLAVCNSVSRADFLGKRVIELWPNLFGSVGCLRSVRLLPRSRRQRYDTAIITNVFCQTFVRLPAEIIRPKLQQPLSLS